jgi:hypothetical protein
MEHDWHVVGYGAGRRVTVCLNCQCNKLDPAARTHTCDQLLNLPDPWQDVYKS